MTKATLRIPARAAAAMRPRRACPTRDRPNGAVSLRSRHLSLERLENRELLSGVGPFSAQDGDTASYPFTETFDEGPSEPGPFWAFTSTPGGRVALVDDGGDTVLRMDSAGGAATNEAVLTIDLSGRSGVRLFFLEQNVGDEIDPEDGLFVRTGETELWTKIHDFAGQAPDWQSISLDLDQAVQGAGLAYSDRFQIKFQQHDNSAWDLDGRQFDDIRVTWEGNGPAIAGYGAIASREPLRLDGFQFVFDEDMSPGSFTVDDVLMFTGPGGTDLRSQIAGVAGSGNTFTVEVAAQTSPGVYEMVLGPNILDVAGNPLNQDGDALVGEGADDRFAISFSLAVPGELKYTEDFSDGLPAAAWTFYSSEGGRIQVAEGELRMDSTGGFALNEAILHLNLAGRSGVVLDVDHINAGDELHWDDLAEEQFYFEPHRHADMISISDDGGKTWFVVELLGDGGHVALDLDTAVVTAGMQYTGNFLVKFQQYDNVAWGSDGRGFDNVVVSSREPVRFALSSPGGFQVAPGATVPVTVTATGAADDLVAFQLGFGASDVGAGELRLESWTTGPAWTTVVDGTLETPGDAFVRAEIAPPGSTAAPVTLGTFDLVAPTTPGQYLLTLDDPDAGELATRIEGIFGPIAIASFGESVVNVSPDGGSQTVWAVGTPGGDHAALAPVGMDFAFAVRYTTSDGNGSLEGLGLRMHYDSSVMTFDSLAGVLADGLTGPPQVVADAEDFDADPRTDTYVQVAWADAAGWPGGDLPAELFSARFVTAADDALVSTISQINFTASSTAEGYVFESTPLDVAVTPTLDVDGNGASDALTDGILMLRYLFGFRGAALVENAVDPTGSRTGADEIATFLDGGRQSLLDVDASGTADALTDGVMLLRDLFGFTGAALVEDALAPSANRTDPAEIAAFLHHFDPDGLGFALLEGTALDTQAAPLGDGEAPPEAPLGAVERSTLGSPPRVESSPNRGAATDAVTARQAQPARWTALHRAAWWYENLGPVARRSREPILPTAAVDLLMTGRPE